MPAGCLLLACLSCGKGNGEWEAELTSKDPFVRGMAAIGLGLQAPEHARVALPVLLATIDRSDLGLERPAAQVLSHVGPFEVPFLLDELVADELMSLDRKGAIMNALLNGGGQGAQAIVECLRGKGMHLVGDLGDVLLSIGDPALPAMADLLQGGTDARLQSFGAFLLGKYGPRARAALPALQAAAKSPDAALQETAQRAIAAIQGGN
ncbi:MAG: hypothetical protein ACI9F9_002449 [Candidatus Paceibacteria bacterium]